MKKFSVISAGFLLSAFAGLVNASPMGFFYDFSASGYAEGESFENRTIDYATFTGEANDLQYTDAYGGGLIGGTGAAADIFINFSQAVYGLSFTAGDGAGDFDAFAVSLFEFGTNSFLGTFSTPLFGGSAEPEWSTLTLPVANVGRAILDPGNAGVLPGINDLGGGVVLTELTYWTGTDAPVPATLPLLALGLAALGCSRRKRS